MRSNRGSKSPLLLAGAVAALLLTAGALLLGPGAEAFAPSNFKAALVGGTSHQRMTTQAITDLDAEFFGITKLTDPMKKAIEEIADANVKVDEDQFLSAKHFDGENFAGGQAFILAGNRRLVISALERENAASARFHLGSALHTIQDFYAHSNWVDSGNSAPNPQLGVEGATITGIAPMPFVTCIDCIPRILDCPDCSINLATGLLTSGYYGGEDRSKPSSMKCSHGGILDGSAKGFFGEGINKDVLACDFSPHANLHAAAVAVAREATKKFIRELRDDITPRQLQLLLGVGPTLAMAIDTTGSMGSVISQVKGVATGIVDSRLGTSEEPSKYVLVPFNDPGVGPTTATTNASTFKAAINGLFASGGGDCPELAMSGMLRALSASDDGGVLFMFTDASAKDGSLAGAVASLAAKKESKVFIMTFGSCSPIDPGYIRIADESGGQLFELLRSEAGSVTQLADFLVRSTAVDVLSVAGPLSGGASHDVPVDSTMTSVTFSVAGTTGVTLHRPDGSIVGTGDPGVSFVPLSKGAIYSVADPEAGEWSIDLTGAGQYSLLVSGESDLDLDTFRFAELRGRPAHDGYFPIDGLPVENALNTVTAVLSGDFSTAEFELRAKDGLLLQSLALDPNPVGEANEFIGEILPPPTSFLVYVQGFDAAGQRYQRVIPSAIAPQPMKITAPPSQVLLIDTTTSYVFKVENFGAEDTFRFTASDDQGYLLSINPSLFTLATGESVEVTVRLRVPAFAVEGTLDTLTVNVDNLALSANNFAVVRSTVVEEMVDSEPPIISSLGAQPEVLWPPNHKLRTVQLLVDVSDDQDPAPACQVSNVTSNEPINGPGDGNTDLDWFVTDPTTLELELRAERAGGGSGRIYSVEVECTDLSGNSARAVTTVTVPHDR